MARSFERWMFTSYRRTVVVSQRDKDELLGINPALAIDVIPNGIDLDYFAPPQETQRDLTTLLFTGNYEYAPNVDAALRLARDILPRLRRRIPAIRLWLVGNAPPPEVQDLASESILVTGRVPDVRPYLAQATAFVCPLRLGAGIKNKVLEALAMGLPVVATPLSLDGIEVKDGRHALIADSDEAIAASVARLLLNPGLQKYLSANGRSLIGQRYTWSHVAAQYESLYAAIR